MHILIVEDEQRLARLLQRVLAEERHAVDVAFTGSEGLGLALSGGYDLVILDRMLPDLDGVEVTRELRGERIATPILMLTARGAIEDRVDGLNDLDAVSNVVDIYIHYLRDKIDRGFPRPLIKTVRGVGYKIEG